MENNSEKIIRLLEEIRDNQKRNFEQAMIAQSKVQKKVFWILFGLTIIVILLIKLL